MSGWLCRFLIMYCTTLNRLLSRCRRFLLRNPHSDIYIYLKNNIIHINIANKKLIGLYPLLPLTKQEETKKPHEIISSAINVIDTITDPVLKADVLSAMSILAAEKYSEDLIKKYVRREQLMQSVLFQEWVADFVDEATEKAIKETQEEIAIEFLREGISIEKVARACKLSIKRVRELKKSLAESNTSE